MKKLLFILTAWMTAATAQAGVRAECELNLVQENGSVFATAFVFGEAETEEAAIKTTFMRSIYSCREMYQDAEFGDAWDCMQGGMPRHLCGYTRVTGAPSRSRNLPNPPMKASCIFKKETCQFFSTIGNRD